MATVSAILDRLRDQPNLLPPLELRVEEADRSSRADRPDGVVEVRWAGRAWRFVVESKRFGTPRLLRDAVAQAQRYAKELGLPPLVVVPYLPEKQLDYLLAEGVSGIDLCGNGVVQVPGELLVVRKGEPNRYPASAPIRNVYQGASSMVARVYLLRPQFPSVGAVRREIEERGGRVSPGTVSKVLKVLEDDLIIQRDGPASRLLQPTELLDKLAANFQRPTMTSSQTFKWTRGGDVRLLVAEKAAEAKIDLVATGSSSADLYSAVPEESVARFYCRDIPKLLDAAGSALEPVTRFADVELIQADDPLLFFDARDEVGVRYVSPVQCWLELQAGDKRQQDVAEQVKQRILTDLAAQETPA